MIKSRSRIAKTALLLIFWVLIAVLSGCADFQNQTQQAAGRVIANTAPPVQNTPTNPPSEAVEVEPAPMVGDDAPEVLIGPPVIDRDTIAEVGIVGRAAHNDPQRVVWALDGQSFGIVNNRQAVKYSTPSLAIDAVYAAQEPAYILDYSPDGKTVAITEDQSSIQLWDIETIQQVSEITPGPFSEAIFLPDGNSLAVSLLEEIAVQIIEVDTGITTGMLSGFDTAAPVYRVKFISTGDVMIWIARSGVQLMAYPSMEMGPEFYHEDFINDAALQPSGELLAVATAGTVGVDYTPFLQLWNVEDGSSGGEIPLGRIPNSIEFSVDGDLILSPLGSLVVVWQTATLTEVNNLDGHSGEINGLALSPDGRQLVTTADDNQIILWQVAAE
jgi:WD40 repeat protein